MPMSGIAKDVPTMASKLDLLPALARPGIIACVNEYVAWSPVPESVAVTVPAHDPTPVGVPESNPVEVLKDTAPPGYGDALIDHVIDPVAPVTES